MNQDETQPQRSATRAPVDRPVRLLFDDSLDPESGVCGNISIGGMFVLASAGRPAGSLVRFELILPEERVVRGLGEVVWMRAAPEGLDQSAMGVRFRFLEQRDRQMIFKLVSHHIKERLASKRPGEAPAYAPPDLPTEPLPASAFTVPGPPEAEVLEDEPLTAPPPPVTPTPTTSTSTSTTTSTTVRPGDQRPLERDVENAPAQLASIDNALHLDASPSSSEPPFLDSVGARNPDRGFDGGLDRERARPDRDGGLLEPEPDFPLGLSGLDSAASESTDRDGVDLSVDAMVNDMVESMVRPGERRDSADATAGHSPDLGESPVPAGDLAFDRGTDWAEGDDTRRGDDRGAVLPRKRREPPVAGVLFVALLAVGVLAFLFRDTLFSGLGGRGNAAPAHVEVASPADADPVSGTDERAGDTADGPAPLTDTEPPTDVAAPAREAVTTPPPVIAPPVIAPPPAAPPPAAQPTQTTPPTRTAAPTERAFSRVEDITWRASERGGTVRISTNGAVEQGRFRYFRLEGASPREVIVMSGVDGPFGRAVIPVQSPLVAGLRTGYHRKGGGNEVHVVVDLGDPEAVITAYRVVGRRLEVDIERP